MDIAKALRKAAVVRYGRVRLSSGAVADFYIDVKAVYADPVLLRVLARALERRVPSRAASIGVTGYGGLPLGTAVALQARLPLTLVREKPKRHGRATWLDGYVPIKDDRVVLVDDVYMTGASIKRMENIVRSTGARIVARLVVVDRSGKPSRTVRSLVNVKEIMP